MGTDVDKREVARTELFEFRYGSRFPGRRINIVVLTSPPFPPPPQTSQIPWRLKYEGDSTGWVDATAHMPPPADYRLQLAFGADKSMATLVGVPSVLNETSVWLTNEVPCSPTNR